MFSKHYPCKLSDIENVVINRRNNGFVFRKNWEYTKLFNYHLLMMKESGLMDKLFEPYLKLIKKSCPNEQIIRSVMKKPEPLRLNTTFSIFMLIVVGIVCGLVLLYVEIVYFRYCQRN